MHPKFLPLLVCPETRGPLTLHARWTQASGIVITGELRAAGGKAYPIVRGIPRFVGAEQYASSFGFEWTRWPRVQFESENVGRPMEGHTTRMWERITNADDRQVAARTIVDFGCGPGRFLDVVRRKGGLAVGIDLSQAVEAARKNFENDPDVLIVQGDLLKPPFRNAAFDGGFSIGVLHHTPNPRGGFAALAQSVRPGGWVSCCVYPKDDFYDFASVRRFRSMHARLSQYFGYAPALAYSQFAARVLAPLFRRLKKTSLRPAVSYVERNWLVSLWLRDVRWRVLDTFDAITPKLASTHAEAEVAEWFGAAGCSGVHRTDWCPTAAVGTRLSEAGRLARAA